MGGLGSVGLSEGPTVDMRECGEEDREGEAVDGVESDAEIVVKKVVAFADILSIVNCHIEEEGYDDLENDDVSPESQEPCTKRFKLV